jgi:hypothetical protein
MFTSPADPRCAMSRDELILYLRTTVVGRDSEFHLHPDNAFSQVAARHYWYIWTFHDGVGWSCKEI